MAKLILALVMLLSLAAAPSGSAAASPPCHPHGIAMAAMDMGVHRPAPAGKCCDPVTKACLPSCPAGCAAILATASVPPTAVRPLAAAAVPGLPSLQRESREPDWLDPPPKLPV